MFIGEGLKIATKTAQKPSGKLGTVVSDFAVN